MSGAAPRRIDLDHPERGGIDWTARIALGSAAAFTLLLGGFGLVLLQAWPEPAKVRTALAGASVRMDAMAAEQRLIQADLGSLRRDVRDDRAERAQSGADVAVLRARVAELSGTVTALRDQTERLARASEQPRPDPAVDELRQRLGTMQERLDQIAAAVASGPRGRGEPARADGAASAPQSPVIAPALPAAVARPAAFDVDQVDREVRDMEAVVRASKRGAAAGRPVPGAAGASGGWSRPVPFVTPPRAPHSTIADPLAPLTSRTPPRVAPVKGFVAPRPLGVPTASVVPGPLPAAARGAAPDPAERPEPEARVTRVGQNNAQRALGPLGLPFDLMGNLLAAIGEGIDRLLTGRVYVERPEQAPATARLDR